MELSMTPREGKGRHIITLEKNYERGWDSLARIMEFVDNDGPKPQQVYHFKQNQFLVLKERMTTFGRPRQGEWALGVCGEDRCEC